MKIIKIGAMWCPACLIMNKIWNRIMEDYSNIEIISLDLDMDSEEVSKYNPGKILPVIIFISDDNSELDRLVGEQKEEKIRELIMKYDK